VGVLVPHARKTDRAGDIPPEVTAAVRPVTKSRPFVSVNGQ